jgi:hypothetical protein
LPHLLAQFLEVGLVDRAVVFHLLGVPPAADAENKAPARELVERGHAFAVWIVSRWITRHTPVASFSRLVNAAAALNVTKGSITS